MTKLNLKSTSFQVFFLQCKIMEIQYLNKYQVMMLYCLKFHQNSTNIIITVFIAQIFQRNERPKINFTKHTTATVHKSQTVSQHYNIYHQCGKTIQLLGTIVSCQVKLTPLHFRSGGIDVVRLPSDQVRISVSRIVKGLKVASDRIDSHVLLR